MSCCKDNLTRLRKGYLYLPKIEKVTKKKVEKRPAPKDTTIIEIPEEKADI